MNRRSFLSLAALTAGAAALSSKVAAAVTTAAKATTETARKAYTLHRTGEPTISIPAGYHKVTIELWGAGGRESSVSFDAADRMLDGTYITAIIAKRTDGEYTILTHQQSMMQLNR